MALSFGISVALTMGIGSDTESSSFLDVMGCLAMVGSSSSGCSVLNFCSRGIGMSSQRVDLARFGVETFGMSWNFMSLRTRTHFEFGNHTR